VNLTAEGILEAVGAGVLPHLASMVSRDLSNSERYVMMGEQGPLKTLKHESWGKRK
jgi:hypothetical protein